MSRRVWKVRSALDDKVKVTFPAPWRVLHVDGFGLSEFDLWAEVETDGQLIARDVYVVGTGNPMPDEAREHLGSFQSGPFVWHIYLDDYRNAEVSR